QKKTEANEQGKDVEQEDDSIDEEEDNNDGDLKQEKQVEYEFLGGVAIEFIQYFKSAQRLELQLIADTLVEEDEIVGDISMNIIYLPKN
ncbi:MAG: hypothetical protein EZS28_054643, partial [Streblomastix strix]